MKIRLEGNRTDFEYEMQELKEQTAKFKEKGAVPASWFGR